MTAEEDSKAMLARFTAVEGMPGATTECILNDFPQLQIGVTFSEVKDMLSKRLGIPANSIKKAVLRQSASEKLTALIRIVVDIRELA